MVMDVVLGSEVQASVIVDVDACTVALNCTAAFWDAVWAAAPITCTVISSTKSERCSIMGLLVGGRFITTLHTICLIPDDRSFRRYPTKCGATLRSIPVRRHGE